MSSTLGLLYQMWKRRGREGGEVACGGVVGEEMITIRLGIVGGGGGSVKIFPSAMEVV
jgi:hypothetical protein